MRTAITVMVLTRITAMARTPVPQATFRSASARTSITGAQVMAGPTGALPNKYRCRDQEHQARSFAKILHATRWSNQQHPLEWRRSLIKGQRPEG